MKFPAIATCTLVFAGFASAKPSEVQVLNAEPSFQHVRILTLYEGKPLQGVRLEVFSKGERHRLSLVTNEEGVAKLSLAPPGQYRIEADAAGGLGGDLVLAVSKGKGRNESSFTLELAVRPPLPPTLEQKILAAENTSGARLRKFEGVVVDPIGTAIPQTTIIVFKRGSQGKVRMGKAKSDATGHFSARLADGSYTAVFSIPGFSTYIVALEITQDVDPANVNGLRVSLQLAPST
jgi:hypothetical protein